jgi:hypothetical protein
MNKGTILDFPHSWVDIRTQTVPVWNESLNARFVIVEGDHVQYNST